MVALHKIKLATKVQLFVFFVIVALSGVIGFQVVDKVRGFLADQVATSTEIAGRTAAAMLVRDFPTIAREGDRFVFTEIPVFANHNTIDEVGEVTGQTSTIFVWDEGESDFIRRTTNIIKDNGDRAVGTPLGRGGRVFPVLERGEVFVGEATILGKDYYTRYVPVFELGGDKVLGIIYVGLEQAKTIAQEREVIQTFIIASVVCTIIALLIAALVMARILNRPIQTLCDSMMIIADRNFDAEIVGLERGDEIGDMARTVRTFKENGIEMKRLEEDQLRQKEQAEAQARAEREKIADQLEQAVGGVVAAVGDATGNMRDAAQTLSATAGDTDRQSGEVASASQQATDNVESVAAATEELTSSVSEISRQVSDSTKIAKRAVDAAKEANQRVSGLVSAAERVGEVVTLIQDISEQTNLLALNATIEAARAGDAGKGFAVVASEVKNLANQTGRAIEDIGAQINSMLSATDEAVVSINAIGDVINEINEISAAIAGAVEEQTAATSEIARNVEEAAVGSNRVSEGISLVRSGAGETGTAANDIMTAVTTLNGHAETLQGQVDTALRQIRAG